MTLNDEMFYGLVLAIGAFLSSMALTPIYTHFAYKYKFWKKQKKTTVTGDSLPVMTKLHAHKFRRPFPTMAGIIGLVVRQTDDSLVIETGGDRSKLRIQKSAVKENVTARERMQAAAVEEKKNAGPDKTEKTQQESYRFADRSDEKCRVKGDTAPGSLQTQVNTIIMKIAVISIRNSCNFFIKNY